MRKICSKCKQSKDLIFFNKDKRRKDGRGSWCYQCSSSIKRNRIRLIHNCIVCNEKITTGRTDKLYCSDTCGKRLRSYRYALKKYGLTLEQFFDLLAQQNNVCAICKNKDITNRWTLSVDHCHDTGKIRGLLCSRCNIGIGMFNDKTDLLYQAAKYLGNPEIALNDYPADKQFSFSELKKTGCPKEYEHGPYDKKYKSGHRYCSKCKVEKEKRRRLRLKNLIED